MSELKVGDRVRVIEAEGLIIRPVTDMAGEVDAIEGSVVTVDLDVGITYVTDVKKVVKL